MEIRRAKAEDLGTLLALYEGARAFMAQNGNPDQWGDSYPPRELVEADIASGHSYLCVEGERVLGGFYFAVEEEANYRRLDGGRWLNDRPYGVVHRVASSKGARGVAAFCLDWCLAQCGNVRIDTHRQNLPMQRTLRRCGFSPCGTVYMDDGSERIAFQRAL